MSTVTPRTRATRDALDKLTESRRADAEQAHARYPQYANHWDDWRIAEITRRVRTKSGVAFERGDLVLVAPTTYTEKVPPRGQPFAEYHEWPEREFATAYSFRTGNDTAVLATEVREVQVIDDPARTG